MYFYYKFLNSTLTLFSYFIHLSSLPPFPSLSLSPPLSLPPPSLHQRANSDSNIHGPYMKGSTSSFKKLSKFFGEEPPRVEDIETFLEGLGYSHLYPVRTYIVSKSLHC